MECKRQRSNCKQFIGTHKLIYQTNTKQNLGNNSLKTKRSRHNIKSKTVDGHKCKKCQEKAKNKDNHEDLFIEKGTTKHIQQVHKKKEMKIRNTIKPSEATKFKETINKDGFKMETRKKNEGNMIVYGETNDLNRNKHISTNNTKKIQKPLEVTFSDQSDSSTTKRNKKNDMEKAHIRQKNILHTVSNNCKKMNLYTNVIIKEGEIQKLNNLKKQDEHIGVRVQPGCSTFSTSTKDSTKDLHSYIEEMNIIKYHNQMTNPQINVASVEDNINNIIDIFESKGKLKTEKTGGPVGDTEKLKCQLQQEEENITKHKNVEEKKYLLAGTDKQIEDLISKVMIQNEIQGANLSNKMIKKKSRFSNTFKDSRREERAKTFLKYTDIKPSDNATLSCVIYENSIGERTPRSQKSLSDSCLRLKRKIYKYKCRKSKILSRRHSTKNLSNNKQSKSLQNIKQNNHCNNSSECNQKIKGKQNKFTNISASNKSTIEPEKLRNDCDLQKFIKINNTYPKYDSDNLSISESLSKINLKERVANEDQWCFADPELYSCDSELILDDGEGMDKSSTPTNKFISPENSNESWNDEKICNSNISVFEMNSVASSEDINDKFSEANNTLECSNGKDVEPMMHISTIQNEYNKIRSKPNENCYYKNEGFNNDMNIHSSNKNVENDMSKRLIKTFPHQSAVTLISGFGSKSSFDNRKTSEGDLNQLNSSIKNTDISLTITKDVAVSASTSYEILRKTKFLADKAIMCYEAVPSKVKKQRREKLKKIQQFRQREKKQMCDTLLGKQGEIHHSSCITISDILNQGDNETIEKNVSQHRKYKGIYTDKRQLGRNTKHHNSTNKEILQNNEENKTDTCIKQEELEDVKLKFKDNFTIVYNKETIVPRQSKGFWNSLRTGSRRLIRFLQDSASFKYCFKKNMFK